MNKVFLQGRLTKDIELMSSKGKEDKQFNYCYFTVAIDRVGSNHTDFIPCKVFGQLAESCSNTLAKGNTVRVKGILASDKYEKDGKTVYSYNVLVNEISKVVSTFSTGCATVNVVDETKASTLTEVNDDENPF